MRWLETNLYFWIKNMTPTEISTLYDTWLSMVLLIGIFYTIRYWTDKYIEKYAENKTLERALIEKKDLEFLKKVNEIPFIVNKVTNQRDDKHEKAHLVIWEKIDIWHKHIWGKLDEVILLIKK